MMRCERRASSKAARASPAVAAEPAAAPRHSYAERDACICAHSRAWLAAGAHPCFTHETAHVSRPGSNTRMMRERARESVCAGSLAQAAANALTC